MKPFLYLVQSRLANLNQYQDLESETSDVLYLTFEEKIDKPNYLYAPNTCWTSGRNCLIEAAKKLNDRYEYYIMLDDDLDFIGDNGFRTFEEEVLEVRPYFSAPIYVDAGCRFLTKYERLIRPLIQRDIFRCSHFAYFDSAFICLSRELFFNETLLPYDTEYLTVAEFKNSYYSSELFWHDLLEYHSHRKLYVINKVSVRNMQHLNAYNGHYHPKKLKKIIKKKDPNYKYILKRKMPVFKAIEITKRLMAFLECQEDRFPQGTMRRKFLEWLIYYVFISLIKIYVGSFALVRDIHLAYQMRKERQES